MTVRARTCTRPCAPSASAPSSPSAARSRTATTSRSRSRSTSSGRGPALYEYRPLVRAFVEARAARSRARRRAHRARGAAPGAGGGDLRPRPRGAAPTEEQALFRTVLLPLLVATAEACGGFDWDDAAFERAYAELEPSLFGGDAATRRSRRSSASRRDAGRARRRLRVRAPPPASSRTLAGGAGLLPAGFGREADRSACWSSSGRSSPARSRRTRRASSPTRSPRSGSPPPPRSRPARSSSSGSTGGRTGSGRCCRSPRRSRRASRRGSTRSAPSSRATCSRGSRSPMRTRRSPRRSTAGSSRSSRPSRSAPSSCAARSPPCSGETWELRAAVLLGEPSEERRAIHAALRALAAGEPATARAEAAVRRSLVEMLEHGDRAALIARSTRRCSGCGRRRCVGGEDDALGRSRSAPCAGVHVASTAWTKPASSIGSTGSTRSTGRARRPASCSRSCAACSTRQSSWRAAGRRRRRDGEEVVERPARRLLGT